MFNNILKEEIDFVTKGSGLSLLSIVNRSVAVEEQLSNPLSGSSYINMPEYIKNNKAVINVKNTDDKCFKYAILTKFNNHQDNKHNFKVLEKKICYKF